MMNKNKNDKIYFTVTGLFMSGLEDIECLAAGTELVLVKEPDNKHDSEAILVKLPGVGKIGYVANSVHTVIGEEAFSAGRLYDKIGDTATAVVKYNFKNALQGELVDAGL